MSQKNTPPEPFGHFKAEAFGWTDCAETDEGAQPLYDQAAIDELGERLMVSDYALKDAERQRDALLAAIRGVLDDAEECQDADDWTAMLLSLEAFHNLDTAYNEVIASVKGGA